jgi:uncharacterized membrane protein YqiK
MPGLGNSASDTVLLTIGLLGAIVFILFSISRILSFIRKVPANQALLVFGVGCRTKIRAPRHIRKPDGTTEIVMDEELLNYRIVRGGMTLVFPVIQTARELDLRVYPQEVKVIGVLSNNAVPVDIDGIAQMSISSDMASIATAARLHLDKPIEDVFKAATETFQGHVRAIVGLMSPEDLYKNRELLSQRVTEVASGDMASLGLSFQPFVIREIKDGQEYFRALGRPQIAAAKRDASPRRWPTS